MPFPSLPAAFLSLGTFTKGLKFSEMELICLKVPKCEIFDFNYFYVMKCLKVGDLEAEIKNYYFLKFGPDTYHFIFASVGAVYAGNNF